MLSFACVLLLLLLAASLVTLASSTLSNCTKGTNPGWILFRDTGWVTWDEAKTHCETLGTTMASVLTSFDNDDIANMHSACGWGGGTFIGGFTNQTDCTQWQWHDGSTWSYTAWDSSDACALGQGGQPNSCTVQQCVEWMDDCQLWNNVDCDSRTTYYYLCNGVCMIVYDRVYDRYVYI